MNFDLFFFFYFSYKFISGELFFDYYDELFDGVFIVVYI